MTDPEPVIVRLPSLPWWRRLALARAASRARRAALAELRRLPDWRLTALGIDRARIPEVVDGLLAGGRGWPTLAPAHRAPSRQHEKHRIAA